MNKGKILIGAFAALALAGGLFFVNKLWIAPVLMRQAQAKGISAAGNHPMAPDFSLPGINGDKLNLADYKGKVLMVDFWATWCGPCRIEIPGFVELENRYRDQDFAILGISMDDSPDPVREFYKQFKMNYPVGMGNDELVQVYGALGYPTTFMIGRDGRIYAKHTGTTDISVFEEEIKTLLAAKPGAEAADFKPVSERSKDDIEIKTPQQVKAENNPDIPGVDFSMLTPAQLADLKTELKRQQCTCGCNMNVLDCRQKDPGCDVSLKLAKQARDKIAKNNG